MFVFISKTGREIMKLCSLLTREEQNVAVSFLHGLIDGRTEKLDNL